MTTLAFDVYGTLINTHGLVSELADMMGDNAHAFSNTWREKQLEYSFRRGLMQNYVNFAVCTQYALDYACLHHKTPLSDAQKAHLLDAYRTLPAFDDASEALEQLNAAGHRLFAFSNGSQAAVETLLTAANLRHHFIDVVSVDEVKSFKPNPAVYSHFLRCSQAQHYQTWLISSNPFDVTGAISAGMKAAWIQRSQEAIFDPWEIQPTTTIERLTALPHCL